MIEDQLNNECHYPLTMGEYHIYDDHINAKPLFVNDDEKWNLKIINESNTDVNFYQNDGCIMQQITLKKCDWICVFNNDFYFIEAKDVNIGQRRRQREDAVEKFNATLLFYFQAYPALLDMNLNVIMNFRHRANRLTNAANKDRALYFKEKFNANYTETNYLDFT